MWCPDTFAARLGGLSGNHHHGVPQWRAWRQIGEERIAGWRAHESTPALSESQGKAPYRPHDACEGHRGDALHEDGDDGVTVDESAVKERYAGLPRRWLVQGFGISGVVFEVPE